MPHIHHEARIPRNDYGKLIATILLALPIAAAIKITWGHVIKGNFSYQHHA